MQMGPLPRPRRGLLRHQLDGQTLVYDPRTDRVHLLDSTTGHLLQLLEQGGWSRKRICGELAGLAGTAEGGALLVLSLGELEKAELLDEADAAPAKLSDLSRREMLGRLGKVGISTLLIPAIITLAPDSAYAASCAMQCEPCHVNNCCGSLLCLSVVVEGVTVQLCLFSVLDVTLCAQN